MTCRTFPLQERIGLIVGGGKALAASPCGKRIQFVNRSARPAPAHCRTFRTPSPLGNSRWFSGPDMTFRTSPFQMLCRSFVLGGEANPPAFNCHLAHCLDGAISTIGAVMAGALSAPVTHLEHLPMCYEPMVALANYSERSVLRRWRPGNKRAPMRRYDLQCFFCPFSNSHDLLSVPTVLFTRT